MKINRTTRTAPKRILKRPRDPIAGSMGPALSGQVDGVILLVVPRVGTVRHLPPGYELAECAECSSPVWANARFLSSRRRRGMKVRVECSTCSLGE